MQVKVLLAVCLEMLLVQHLPPLCIFMLFVYTPLRVFACSAACHVQAERPGGGLVAVKALSLRSMADWKQLELFEREAAALRSLSHAGIPAYMDYFEVDSDGDRAYFLVQVSHCTCCIFA